MQIDDKMLDKLEHLSALQVDENKREEFKKQLSEIANFVEILNELDLHGVSATVSTIDAMTPFREDVPRKSDVIGGILENAPKIENNFFEVAKIIE